MPKRIPYALRAEEQKEAARAATRRFRAKHPARMLAYNAQSAANRREKYRTDETYRETCKAASRATMPEVQRIRRARLKKEVFDHYGWMCACCGETKELFLTLGHVNGDGATHRKTVNKGNARGGNSAGVYLDIIRRGFPAGYRTECYNCNCGSFRNAGTCPHLRAKLTTVAPQTDVSTGLLPCAPEVPPTAPGL